MVVLLLFIVAPIVCGGSVFDPGLVTQYLAPFLVLQGSYRQVCVKFTDFLKTFLLFSRSENLYKILIYK